MKRFYRTIYCGLAAIALCGSLNASAAKPNGEDQRYIISFSKGQAASGQQAVLNNNGKRPKKLKYRDIMAADLSAKDLAKLLRHPSIAKVEVDPKRYPTAQQVPYGVTMVQASVASQGLSPGSSPMKVCIIDTGYDMGHTDLPTNRVSGEAQPGTGAWDNDGYGHGTHVAGTIAALDNTEGVIGVHAGTALTMHIVKIFNDQGNWTYGSDLIDALDSCVAAGAQVVSMSLGGTGSSASEGGAFAEALSGGVLSIAAAGNSGNTSLSFPASYDSVVSVAAIDSNKNLASFSQRNSQVELAAPGVGVRSTLPGDTYASWSGTSMATPHVSAVAALVWSNNSGCSATQIRQALAATAQDLGASGRDNNYGYGLVQALDAHNAIIQATDCDVQLAEPPAPTITALGNGEVVANLGGGTGSQLYYQIELPDGATNLAVQIAGGSGDADLYLRRDSLPTTGSYDCRPWLNGNNETCSVATPQTPSTYYVMLYGYSTFSGVSLSASYTTTTPPVNQPPVAVISALPVTGKAPLTVSFDSIDSTDDNGIVARNWVFAGADPNVVTGPTETQATYNAEGTYTASLTVTDAGNLEDTAEVTITVLPPNRDPNAAFIITPGSDITTDTLVELDASTSSDPDGDSLSYSWDFGDGTGTGKTVTHTFAAGDHTVALTVDDGFGGTDTSSQDIQVASAPEPITIIDLSLSTNKRGNRITLNWSGASTSRVEIYRGATRITRTKNDGSWHDRSPNGEAYRVCNDGSTEPDQCSEWVAL